MVSNTKKNKQFSSRLAISQKNYDHRPIKHKRMESTGVTPKSKKYKCHSKIEENKKETHGQFLQQYLNVADKQISAVLEAELNDELNAIVSEKLFAGFSVCESKEPVDVEKISKFVNEKCPLLKMFLGENKDDPESFALNIKQITVLSILVFSRNQAANALQQVIGYDLWNSGTNEEVRHCCLIKMYA